MVSNSILKLKDEEWVLKKYDALAYNLARRYHPNVSGAHELEELVQVARIGILEAARTFDDSRGTKFITHAYNSGWHALSRYLRKNPGVIRSVNPARDGVPTMLPLFASMVSDETYDEDVERTVMLDELLDCLEHQEKEVCIKMHMQGMSAQEVAATMPGLNSHKVLVINKTALKKLKINATSMGIEEVI
jgi:RNA polymerase sigma factor (sigma-70 family)